MIGGVIIGGSESKTVLIRARGPSLADFGVAGAMADPVVQLYGASGFIEDNDDWQMHSRAGEVPASLAPTNPKEAAIVADLDAGGYTALVSGVNGTQGVGIVEIFELTGAGEARLLNISTRGFVGTGDDVMIGGVIITGESAATVLFRARGPSLASADANLAGQVIADPTMQLFDGDGNLLEENDAWEDDPYALEIAAPRRPTDPAEAALWRMLEPGVYTVIVRDANGGSGIGIVEAFISN